MSEIKWIFSVFEFIDSANTNPITHQQKNISSDQSSIGLNDETSTIGDFNEVTIGNVSAVSESRKLRKGMLIAIAKLCY